MAINLPNRYPGRFSAPTADYPQGSFKNRTAPGALDGSYLEKDWANDKEGFFQSLIAAAGIVPNELVDKVGASQYYDALLAVIADGLVVPDASTTVKGIVELATGAEATAGTDTSRAVTPAGLASSVLGMGQTWQDVSASRAAGTTYTNTTGKPIMISVIGREVGSSALTMTVGGVTVSRVSAWETGEGTMTTIVPASATYTVTISGSATIQKWAELR